MKMYEADTIGMREADPTISGKISSPIRRGEATTPALTITESVRDARHEAWNQVIDSKLIEWGRDSSFLADDGLEPPSAEAIKRACELAVYFRDSVQAAPHRVVPNGEGGIVFERGGVPDFQKIEIEAGGSVEMASFRNGQLTSRCRVL